MLSHRSSDSGVLRALPQEDEVLASEPATGCPWAPASLHRSGMGHFLFICCRGLPPLSGSLAGQQNVTYPTNTVQSLMPTPRSAVGLASLL